MTSSFDQDLERVIESALHEDLLNVGDVTTTATIPESSESTANFLAKADGVVAGVAVVARVFAVVDANIKVDFDAKDGDFVTAGTVLGRVSGPTRGILTGERTALNLMQRMGGIATLTRRFVQAIKAAGSTTTILDTRKTVPGLRTLDKAAVRMGGGANHRIGLYDMVMIKDNHILAAGGIKQAVERVRAHLESIGKLDEIRVEVETTNIAEVETALATPGVHRIMLDNMVSLDKESGAVDTSRLEAALDVIRQSGVAVETEASGNVTLETVSTIARTNVDFISSGALTHSVTAMDISLKFQHA